MATTEATYQHDGDSLTDTIFWKILERTGASSGEKCLKTVTGPLDLELSRHEMIFLTRFTVIEGEETVSPVRRANGGGFRPPSSFEFFTNCRLELGFFCRRDCHGDARIVNVECWNCGFIFVHDTALL